MSTPKAPVAPGGGAAVSAGSAEHGSETATYCEALFQSGTARSSALSSRVLVSHISGFTSPVHSGIAPAVSTRPHRILRDAEALLSATGSEVAAGPGNVQAVLREVRRKSKLTWAQIAEAVGVQRRTVHFWSNGKPANGPNTERLMELLQAVNQLDAGDPAATTSRLLMPLGGRPSTFALLRERNNHRSAGGVRPNEVELAAEERELRRGLRPVDLLDARHGRLEADEDEYLDSLPLIETAE